MKNYAYRTAPFSRREFLATTGAAIAAATLPGGRAFAQVPAKYRRLNVTDTKAPLESYQRAISKMLALPPSDARNWYRHALIHLLDCPHGNWWFLPWHRGYLGWFEQTCRELSGDQNFALPYWDWTALPRIPAPFFDGVLNPQNNAFIPSLEEFEKQLRDPMSALWKSFSPEQIAQLNTYGFPDFDAFWSSATPVFFPLDQARALTQTSPGLDEPARVAVSARTLRGALRAPDFVSFGSGITSHHGGRAGQGILESAPHDNVHGAIGGFMGAFLSPVDPIFFLHHANIDRIWDVWTRRQEGAGQPTLPIGAELAAWKKELFLFFIDPQGKPVAKNTSGDYATIGDFAYDYQPGSGDQMPFKASPFTNKLWSATMLAKSADIRQSMQADVALPEALPAAAATEEGPAMFARITLKAGVETENTQFHVLVNPPANASQISFKDPSFAGSIRPFGTRHGAHAGQPLTFTLPIGAAVAKLTEAKRLDPAAKLKVQVVAQRRGVALTPVDLEVAEISVGAF